MRPELPTAQPRSSSTKNTALSRVGDGKVCGTAQVLPPSFDASTAPTPELEPTANPTCPSGNDPGLRSNEAPAFSSTQAMESRVVAERTSAPFPPTATAPLASSVAGWLRRDTPSSRLPVRAVTGYQLAPPSCVPKVVPRSPTTQPSVPENAMLFSAVTVPVVILVQLVPPSLVPTRTPLVPTAQAWSASRMTTSRKVVRGSPAMTTGVQLPPRFVDFSTVLLVPTANPVEPENATADRLNV